MVTINVVQVGIYQQNSPWDPDCLGFMSNNITDAKDTSTSIFSPYKNECYQNRRSSATVLLGTNVRDLLAYWCHAMRLSEAEIMVSECVSNGFAWCYCRHSSTVFIHARVVCSRFSVRMSVAVLAVHFSVV